MSDAAEDTEYVEGNAASEDADRPRRAMVAKDLPAFMPIDSAKLSEEELEGQEAAEANAPVLPDSDNAPRSKRMAVAVNSKQILATPAEATAYRRWQAAVTVYRRAGAVLEAAKQEADAAVVELAKFAGRETP